MFFSLSVLLGCVWASAIASMASLINHHFMVLYISLVIHFGRLCCALESKRCELTINYIRTQRERSETTNMLWWLNVHTWTWTWLTLKIFQCIFCSMRDLSEYVCLWLSNVHLATHTHILSEFIHFILFISTYFNSLASPHTLFPLYLVASMIFISFFIFVVDADLKNHRKIFRNFTKTEFECVDFGLCSKWCRIYTSHPWQYGLCKSLTPLATATPFGPNPRAVQ